MEQVERKNPWFTVKAQRIYRRYLEDIGVLQRGSIPVDVQCRSDETEMLEDAQNYVRCALANLQVTVETNPSSNLLIGCFGSFTAHPAFVLSPIETNRIQALPVSINSDDPITFATSLSDEFAYMYYAILEHTLEADSALRWVERARENGLRSRFTHPMSTKKEVLDQVSGKKPAIRLNRRG
jgi:hypothetical protein